MCFVFFTAVLSLFLYIYSVIYCMKFYSLSGNIIYLYHIYDMNVWFDILCGYKTNSLCWYLFFLNKLCRWIHFILMVQAMKIHWNYGNQKCHNLDEISVSGCTQSCFDNFQYSQKFGQHDDISISVLLIVARWCYMLTLLWVNIGSGNGFLPEGTKPLHEPM